MKPKKNKGGRPKKDDLNKKSIAITIRFTPGEFGRVLTRTELANFKSSTSFIVHSALHNTIEQHFLHSDVEFLKDLAAMGNNLNQIARHANTYGFPGVADDARELIGKIAEVVQTISRRL